MTAVWGGARPIETAYRGCRFRSRLEARHAVFLDTLGVPWSYEIEGFELGGIRYLPDFWLPEQGCWVEVKPCAPSAGEREKAGRLAAATGCPVYVVHGEIAVPPEHDFAEGAWRFDPEGGMDNGQLWCECPDCGRLGIRFEGRADRLPCKQCYFRALQARGDAGILGIHVCSESCGGCPRHGANADKGRNFRTDRLIAAYEAARSARFEFGGR